jgi:hypothetical protein
MRRNFDKMSVWHDLVNVKWEKELKTHGDRVVIYQAGDIAVKDYVKGQDMVFEDPKGNRIEIVLDQQKYYAFTLEDIDVKQSTIKDLGDKFVERGKAENTLVKDTFISTRMWDGLTEANTIPKSTLTKHEAYGLLTKLRSRLVWSGALLPNGKGFDGKAPWLVVDPDVMGILSQAPEAIKATAEGDKTTREGTVLKLAGFDIKETNHLTEGSETRKLIAGTTEAFTFINQLSKTKVMPAEKRFGTNYSALYLFGGDVVQEKALAGSEVTLG